MEHQVALYLFRNKTCILPGIGRLSIVNKPAQYLGMEEKIIAPTPSVSFDPDSVADEHFAEWLSDRNSISANDAVKYIDDLMLQFFDIIT